ncbi:MAG: restriction endonuclease subunit S, partial [Petrimonas sp.]|nr:restriction endonuclease subunit S [Petrimonas sp.]
TTEPSRFAEPLSVLLSVRAPVGDINIANRKCCIGRGLASIKSKHAHYSFLFYTMQFLKPLLDKFNGEGTVFGSINRSSLENMQIVIPPSDIIERFERITQKIDLKILNSFNESNNLKNQRDIILPKLMSGELKINDLHS